MKKVVINTIKATFKGIEFNIPTDTAEKILRLQKIFREQNNITNVPNNNKKSLLNNKTQTVCTQNLTEEA